MPPRSTPPPAGPSRRRPGPLMPNLGILVIIMVTVLLFLTLVGGFPTETAIDFSDFTNLVEKGKVSQLTFYGKNLVKGVVSDPNDPALKSLNLRNGKFQARVPETNDLNTFARMLQDKDKAARGDNAKELVKINFATDSGDLIGSLIIWSLPTLLFIGFFIYFILPRFRDPLSGGGFLSNYIKSPARRYEQNKTRVTFEDVADMENAKSELQEVVDFLRGPEKFARLGAQVPKGVLLVGPPGTGKTLLARAVAGEANVPFYSINGSEFIQMFVGVGASRVRDMFKTAKENSPCLLFIDEIDAVGRMRGAGVGGGSDEREQTLNQILSEMDGFQPNEMVLVLAATNRPDVLDSALLRPGRFDRHITVDRPTWQGRLAILKVHTRNKPLADDVNLESIARKMTGMTGADLRNLANEAALLGTREGKSRIERTDFERAADRVLRGPKREEILSTEEKKRTAYHEAGHALVTWLMPGSDRPVKVSIIPRGRSLGVNMFAPDQERLDIGMDTLKTQLVMAMGGRAADRLVLGQPYAGAESDLKQATKIARYMVTHWGMSDRLGPMSFRIGEEHVFLGKEIQEPRDFSEGTAQVIDEEVARLLREADQKAFELLEKNRTDLERLADALLQREELVREEIDELLKKNVNVKEGEPTDTVMAPTTNGQDGVAPIGSGAPQM